MSVTAASFLADPRMAEFLAVSTSVVQAWLDHCAKMLNADRWGAKYDDALTFRTAHTMVRMGVLVGGKASAQAVGAVQSRTVGPVSTTFAVAAPSAGGIDDLQLTPYGLAYKELAKTLIRTPLVM